jgi:hypothetical protein
MSDTLRKGHEHCIQAPCTTKTFNPCITKVLKWGAVLYVAHWVLHGLAFLVSPALGAILLGLI